MKSVIIVLVACLCSVLAAYIPAEHYLNNDEEYISPTHEEYYVVPPNEDHFLLPTLHRFRRQEPRGRVGVEIGHQRTRDPWGTTRNNHARVDASYDFYRSQNGNTRLTGNAYHQRNWGSFPSRDTGAGITFSHRF